MHGRGVGVGLGASQPRLWGGGCNSIHGFLQQLLSRHSASDAPARGVGRALGLVEAYGARTLAAPPAGSEAGPPPDEGFVAVLCRAVNLLAKAIPQAKASSRVCRASRGGGGTVPPM